MSTQQVYETVDLTLEQLKAGLTPEQRARERDDMNITAFCHGLVRASVKQWEEGYAEAGRTPLNEKQVWLLRAFNIGPIRIADVPIEERAAVVFLVCGGYLCAWRDEMERFGYQITDKGRDEAREVVRG